MASFSNFKYDPLDPLTPERVKKEIPEFNFDFPDIDKLILYTIYVYDPHSDILKLFPGDFNRRKREAALKAGFKIGSDGVFDDQVESAIVGENEAYNDAIIAFVVSFENASLPEFVFYRDIFYGELVAGMNAKDSKSKKEVMLNVETARKKLSDLEKKLFSDEEVLSVRNALYRLAEKAKLSLRPEDRARLIQDKELQGVLPNPYRF